MNLNLVILQYLPMNYDIGDIAVHSHTKILELFHVWQKLYTGVSFNIAYRKPGHLKTTIRYWYLTVAFMRA